ncbi:MAG: tRNA lysidine(34) synthetase TilS [Desulfobacteraceae bacterium]|nr:tRNA lysidine(34) synthetase TilS [Desulfobacteraceae bacterium]
MIRVDTIGDPFVREVLETILQFNMIQKKDAVLVGVSGGPDSVTLVLALLFLVKNLELALGIAHFNHGLRGEESQRDENFVKDLAHRLCLPFFGKKMDIGNLAKKNHLSIEEAGRNARYAFFTKIADTHKFTKIATGHNRDDNAEQVLISLLRGAGPRGLSGIPPMRENRFIRPLIQMPKLRILNFLREKDQPFVVDSSNTDESYLRNKIRHNLIPRLEQDFNPEIKSSLDRLSHIIRQEEDFLTAQASQVFNFCMIEENKALVVLSIAKLIKSHPALVNRVLRQAIERVKKDLKRITLAHVQDILVLMSRAESGKSLDLPGRIRVYKTQERLCIQKEALGLRELGKGKKQLLRGVTKNLKGQC